MATAIELDVPTQVYGADHYRESCIIAFPTPTLPLRDIIALKVQAEVGRASRSRELKHALSMRYLTDENLAWAQGGAAKLAPRPEIDVRQEIERALAAFDERRYLVVINRSRCDDLDTPITLTAETTIRFVRILPLRGG
ncbi:MAG: hypothetical protein M3O34_11775 [Chloroflexota bacterium]|nr:hypothetical protein [Chloroflexota bacterium]